MGKIKNMHISFKTFKRLGDRKKCEDLIKVFSNNNLIPLRYDTSERTKYIYRENEFCDFWVNMEIERGYGIPFIRGQGFMASFSWGGAKPYFGWFSISTKVLSTPNLIRNFTIDIFEWAEACYSYASFEEYKKKLSTPGMNIMNCLGDITWANLFGKPYVDMWGEEKVINAPAWKTERLKNGGVILVTTESPFIEKKIAEKYEEKLKEYLGKTYFCRKPIQQETLTYEELLQKSANPLPIIGYKTPDFSKYYDI
jgi:hypothetical protein